MSALVLHHANQLALPGVAGFELPLGREIILLQTQVAGTSHLDGEMLDKTVRAGAELTCHREPSNPHDSWAVRLEHQGTKVGFLPKSRNEVLARLLDAGKELRVRVDRKAWKGEWLVLEVTARLWDG